MLENIILLVEDNPMDVQLTLRAFSKNQISQRVVVVQSGIEALDYLFSTGEFAGRSKREIPCLILLDLNLPFIDGFEVLRQIRADEKTKYVPVVILTTSNEQTDIIKSYDDGANSFIRKPEEFNQFVKTCQHLGIYWLSLNECTGGQFNH